MTVIRFGAGDAQRLDRQYASPVAFEQRRRTLAALALAPGETALDIGCGPGYLAVEMGRQVGPHGRIIAVDTAAPMLAIARARCADVPWVQFELADAARLPLRDASVDCAAAVQVYLFAADLAAVVAELARVLRPGGRAVVVDTDWDSVVWHSSSPERMQRFMEAWTRRYANARVARLFPAALRAAGLRIEEAAAIPIVELAAGDDTYSGSQLTEVARYVTAKSGIDATEATAWADDLLDFSAGGRYFFSLNRFIFTARKPAAAS